MKSYILGITLETHYVFELWAESVRDRRRISKDRTAIKVRKISTKVEFERRVQHPHREPGKSSFVHNCVTLDRGRTLLKTPLLRG